jgi:hypothetical protein
MRDKNKNYIFSYNLIQLINNTAGENIKKFKNILTDINIGNTYIYLLSSLQNKNI